LDGLQNSCSNPSDYKKESFFKTCPQGKMPQNDHYPINYQLITIETISGSYGVGRQAGNQSSKNFRNVIVVGTLLLA